MRQDKMFAMLKFRERTDATAFPHAFVLTVQTVNDSTPVERKEESSSRRGASQTANDDEPVQEIDGGSQEQNHGALDPGTRNYNSDSKDKEKLKDSGRVQSSAQSAAKKSSLSLTEAKNEREKDASDRSMSRKSTRNVENLPGPKSRTRRRNAEKNSEKLPPDSPTEKGIAADLADLPYQYIIEKEIENSKGTSGKRGSNRSDEKSSPGPSNRESDLPGRSLPRSPRGAQVETARSANITDLVMEGLMFTIRQDQDTVTVVEQKTKLEVDEVLENSVKAETKEGEKCLLNSNLLGLENLITKIEMPDLRSKNNNEDSSRSPLAITREPLINRSFGFSSPGLGLPSNYAISPSKYKVNMGLVESPIKPKEIPPRGESIERSPITDKIPLVKINLSNVRDVLSERLRYEGQDSEIIQARKEMDMQLNVTSNRKKEENKCSRTEDELEEEEVEDLELKYDEKDEWESDKNEGDGEVELSPTKAQQNFSMDDPRPKVASELESPSQRLMEREKMVRSTPRVISNEIVTSAQIPPALREALNHKRFKRKRLSYESDTNPDRKAENPSAETRGLESVPEKKSCASPTFGHESPNEKVNEKSRVNSPNPPPSSQVIDITEEFERELASEKSRKLPNRRKSLRVDAHMDKTSFEPPEVRLDMWKFMHDMTRGAKVVVHRLDLTNFPRNVASGSSPVKYSSAAHYVTES